MVSSLLTHWRYDSLAQKHRYNLEFNGMYIQINTARTCSRLLPAVVCSPSIPSQHQTQASRNRNHQNGPHSVPASHVQGQSDTPSCQSARAPSSWDGDSTGGSPCGTDDNWVTFNRADRGNLELKGFPWWLFIAWDPTDNMTLLSRVIFGVGKLLCHVLRKT